MPTQTTKSKRYALVDEFKGLLVVLMIVYHSAFVLIRSSPEAFAIVTSNLVFLHSAFLLVAGLLVGLHYSKKSLAKSSKRLTTRALKLFVVFFACNLAVKGLGSQAGRDELIATFSDSQLLLENVLLSVSGRLFAFEILAYFVIYFLLSAFTIWLGTRPLIALTIAFALATVLIPSSNSAKFLCIALIGQLIGKSIDMNRVSHELNRFKVVAISIFIVTRPLFWIGYQNTRGLVHTTLIVIDTTVWIGATSFLASCLGRRGSELLQKMGAHTLMAYLFQMPCVVLCDRLLPFTGATSYFATLAITFTLTIFVVCLVDRISATKNLLSSGYRLVFQ